MNRMVVVAALAAVMGAQAQELDGGAVAEAASPSAPAVVVAPQPAPAVDAGTAVPPGFDVVAGPWGPGRKSSGELFHSTALALPDGALRWGWNDSAVAVGAQYLARGELRDNLDLDGVSPDHTLGFEQRARLSVRASARARVGALLELQDVRAWGSEPSTTALLSSTGLHQGFVDLKPASWLDARIGRQELSYGEERLVGSLDWSMTARAFDGLFVRASPLPQVTVDAFAMMLKPPAWLVADAGGGRFHNSGSYFGGLYSRLRLGKGGADLYVLGLLEDPSTAALGPQKDNNRFTVGARGFGALGGLALVSEAAFQAGKVGAAQENVVAGAFALKATYTFKSLWGAPYLLGEFSGASGDGAPGDGTEHTFHQLFPTGHAHLGYMDYVGWQNVVAGHGALGLRPWGAHVWLDVHHFRAWAPEGAWFAANGTVFLPAAAGRVSGNMGTELDLSATVPVFDGVAVAGNVSVFLPGLEAQARGSSPSTWGFLSVRCQL